MNVEEYYPGKGCLCHAHSEYECACPDVDWTDPEVYELREQLEALKLERDALWVKTQEDEREINDLRDVNKQLRQWKEEALKVMNQWNEVSEYIRKNSPIEDLGKSIPDLCLKKLEVS